jgi:hypothetical protein
MKSHKPKHPAPLPRDAVEIQTTGVLRQFISPTLRAKRQRDAQEAKPFQTVKGYSRTKADKMLKERLEQIDDHKMLVHQIENKIPPYSHIDPRHPNVMELIREMNRHIKNLTSEIAEIRRLSEVEDAPHTTRGVKVRKSASQGGHDRASTYTAQIQGALAEVNSYMAENPSVSKTEARKRIAPKHRLNAKTLERHAKKTRRK